MKADVVATAPASPETPALPSHVTEIARPPKKRRLGLRARVTTAFALGALALSSVLAGIGYLAVRNSIVNQQLASMRHQALANAVLLRGELRVPTAYIPALITTLDSGPDTDSLIYSSEHWYPSSATLSPRQLPLALRTHVLAGTAAWQVVGSSGVSELIVGVPIHAQTASRTENAAYFEIFDLSDLTRTLHALLAALALAALITTVAGAVLGRWASARTLRPLRETTQAALAIAGGRLGTRLESADFADLAPFASAFNQMVDQLQERIEREARFTSDVNHELRSPLTTLANSLSVLEARRDELPPRALQALDLLGAEVRRFRRLVDELLEISRIDAKPDDISRDEVTIGSLVEHTVQATGTNVPTQFGPGVASQHILVDKRRFERIFANLFENAQRYAGGVTLLAIEDHGDTVRFLVEDAGPGIAPEERDRIFERFSRGSTGRRRGLGDGTGLGLAIVAQHVNQHGGRVWVEERLGGGSRFVVELPAWSEVVT
ncbi:MAG: HAMP domain-containing sensor histidine kinase [Acidimicrobiales bacterium]|jgi:signal transduction histidine kinase